MSYEYTPHIAQKPLPEQLFKLSAIAVCLAKEQDKLKESSKKNNARLFVPKYREELEITADRSFKHTTQIFAGRVARHGFGRDKHWTMRITERFWVEDDDLKEAMHSTYSFGWNEETVVIAEKITFSPDKDDETYDILPEVIDDSVFNVNYICAISEYQQMSQADCTYLIDNVSLFAKASVIDALQR